MRAILLALAQQPTLLRSKFLNEMDQDSVVATMLRHTARDGNAMPPGSPGAVAADFLRDFTILDIDVKAAVRHAAFVYRHGRPLIVTASFDRCIEFRDLDTGKLLHAHRGTEGVSHFTVSHQTNRIAYVINGMAYIILCDSFKEEMIRRPSSNPKLTSACLSKNGSLLLAVHDGAHSKIWDLTDQPDVVVADNYISGGVFDPNSEVLATTSFVKQPAEDADEVKVQKKTKRKQVGMWKLDGKRLDNSASHTDGVCDVDFSSTENRIVTASMDKTIQISSWSQEGISDSVQGIGHTGHVLCAKFTPIISNSEYIVSGSADSTVRIWDTQGTSVAVIEAHTKRVTSVDISPDGTLLLTASEDGTIKVRRLAPYLFNREQGVALQ
jgi:WD40 repeat protein